MEVQGDALNYRSVPLESWRYNKANAFLHPRDVVLSKISLKLFVVQKILSLSLKDLLKKVKLGTVHLNDNAQYVQHIAIDKIISHPKYKRSMNYYDIAILKLKRPINISKNIMPICLQTKPIPNLQQLVNMSLIVTGWGATSFEDEGSEILKKTPSLQIEVISKTVGTRNF
ncbi:PREDICTED: serine protease snake-like [Ceratosolen solmsi marchali]|uniref:Serine protease snake-like n=1 Tax=Ceratosolen solmsi marchali TaxID=326594 RepID=A0AAJ6YDN0_9HYME|nr:PREDICTED: serine protease snake-like [Ceratosolen solmsi marchali]